MENTTPIPPDGPSPTRVDAPVPDAAKRGHETTDASVRPIVMFLVIMFTAAAAIQGAVWGYMRYEQHGNTRADPEPSPFAEDRSLPPEPRLQPSVFHPSQPHEDLAALREKWHTDLTTYGMVPGQADRARIPLRRAMELMVEHGLPTSRPATVPSGVPTPTDGGAP